MIGGMKVCEWEVDEGVSVQSKWVVYGKAGENL